MTRNLLYIIVLCLAVAAPVRADSMTFDRTQWRTGDMNQQAPADSNGAAAYVHIDDFYYYERLPVAMPLLSDSLRDGSSQRCYDSAVFSLVVSLSNLSGSDTMIVFGKRLTRPWSEDGVSWLYHHASPDSAWTTAGGDFAALPCTDTLLIDAATQVYDTLIFHLDTGFVRSMIEGADYGWLMMAENLVDRAVFQVFTEDYADDNYRPCLVVYFTDNTSPETPLAVRRRRSQTIGGKL